MSFNLSGTLNVLRLIANPTLCLPHHTVSTFNELPVPLSRAFAGRSGSEKVDIRAVVLDKDNCFAVANTNNVYEPYKDRFKELRDAYPGAKLLIVSNSAGTLSDPNGKEADILEKATGVSVMRHNVKKPGCGPQVLDYFRSKPETKVTSPSQIAVVGDRLFTDVMLANMMGSHSIWIKDGVKKDEGLVSCLKSEG